MPFFLLPVRRNAMLRDDWSLSKIPPKGDSDVAEFANKLYVAAKAEKERLGKSQDFLNNHSLYKGQQPKIQTSRKGYNGQKLSLNTPINLYFANVERTVSNITARNPVGEVVDLDGQSEIEQETGITVENILSMKLKTWWKETNQQQKTRQSGRQMEIYGITPERPFWDRDKDRPDIMPTDPFCVFPAPGNWDNLAEEPPYVCFAYVGFVSLIEDFYGVKDIAKEDAYDLLGLVRETYKPQGYGTAETIGNYSDPMTIHKTEGNEIKSLERCLVIEVWVRDNSTRTEKAMNPIMNAATESQATDPITGELLFEETSNKVPVYRDGIRKITITKTKDPGIKNGLVVLDDSANPNLNPALEDELARTTYPWGKIAVYHANSYKDGMSVWGFSAAEQVGDLLQKINIIFTKLISYVINVMAPPLIVQKNCGITKEMITNVIQKSGRLILMPSIPNARIEFMTIPNLPETFFRVLELIIMFFDRIYQIEDADRGIAPKGVIAASAIVALQERNQVLMQAKTSAIDYLVEERSKWMIGLMQNFGTREEMVSVNDQTVTFRGVQYAGRKFNYMVESGSTMPRTSLQNQELAFKLFDMKAIGQRGLLEALNWPNWKAEIERTAETQLDQALMVLIDAGLPEEQAVALRQFLLSSSIQNQQNTQKKVSGTKSVPTVSGGK
jgi:hypothetical protein